MQLYLLITCQQMVLESTDPQWRAPKTWERKAKTKNLYSLASLLVRSTKPSFPDTRKHNYQIPFKPRTLDEDCCQKSALMALDMATTSSCLLCFEARSSEPARIGKRLQAHDRHDKKLTNIT
ncbi:hypothetical protein GOP47_0021314 [Adiantum capillus-veneris]|uniref:Uncharacterized protein n=1 Tax=Adiantum capillus-veneris TaxID=13818 RepID=A0A9D4Z7R7_ADICA|nr:hypothetical protein GOP47_0021314 [Adiantum capillus-veneris]